MNQSGQSILKKSIMKKAKYLPDWMLLLTGIVLVLIYAILQIPGNEGFNPSDDGVILAQSYRLIQGQIPHLDFISIRPVGSAILHAINFFSFMPLEISARWLTLLEYLIFSLAWTWLFVKCWRKQSVLLQILLPVILGIWVFILNQNHYNLFPWTTIDAVFLFSMALFFYLLPQKNNTKHIKWHRLLLISMFAVSASLCRQTFALPSLILLVILVSRSLIRKKFIVSSLAILLGAFPGWIYLGLLLKHGLISDFISQMTGRTELWQTGIVRFGYEFWHSPALGIFLALVAIVLYKRLSQVKLNWMSVLLKSGGWFDQLSLLLAVLIAFMIFIIPTQLFSLSFILFWLLLSQFILAYYRQNVKSFAKRLTVWILILAWTSAISLGDNAPVFSTGLLFGGILINTVPFMRIGLLTKPYLRVIWYIGISSVSIIFLAVGIWGQMQNNYRDLGAESLHFGLAEEYPEMGPINTNQRTFAYLQEINRIYHQLDMPLGRFVVIPNGTLIYPLLDSPNPFPLDWMQGPEFVGQDSLVRKRMSDALDKEEIFVLLDRFNSKLLADTLLPMMFDLKSYSYYGDLINHTTETDVSSEWFTVRKSK